VTTVTGLTADRMLAIEAASVVDGDVDASGNLILTQHGGTQINAGSVIGPQGPQGPVGSMLSVITAQPVLDVGVINQIRAGRQLGPADFGNMGLSAPLGLWNLSDLSDVSGNGRALSNKGAVGFAPGINGGANTAAQFTGSVAQALYISDIGANDPFRIRTGTIGCWFRTARLATTQAFISKWSTAAGNYSWWLGVAGTNNTVAYNLSYDGSGIFSGNGVSVVNDDRWHFAVITIDASFVRVYVDGVLESKTSFLATIFSGAGPLNIGTQSADASTAGSSPHYGRVDEAFITSDILDEEQIRNLYCAKIPHTNGAPPARFTMNVRRRRRGGALVPADFPTQPLRLHNFSAGSVGDEGSNNVALTSTRVGVNEVAGVDGTQNNAYHFNGNANTDFHSTDAGLPAGTASRSYGCWFKTTTVTAQIMLAYAGNIEYIAVGAGTSGYISTISGSDTLNGGYVADGLWHFVVVVEDNGPIDGIKHKLFVDGKMQSSSATLGNAVLGGATSFRIGSDSNGTNPFNGDIDAAFICNYALTMEQIAILYAKSVLALTPSPKNPGDHIEGADINNLYAIFDTLDNNAQIDLKVAS
jgi:hypothetical protein